MKVKIGNKVYDAQNEPIMIIVNVGERRQIGDMSKDSEGKYCQYPETISRDEIREWMKKDE